MAKRGKQGKGHMRRQVRAGSGGSKSKTTYGKRGRPRKYPTSGPGKIVKSGWVHFNRAQIDFLMAEAEAGATSWVDIVRRLVDQKLGRKAAALRKGGQYKEAAALIELRIPEEYAIDLLRAAPPRWSAERVLSEALERGLRSILEDSKIGRSRLEYERDKAREFYDERSTE